MKPLNELPKDLPVPVDDGACDHLAGLDLPNLSLSSTNGDEVNLSELRGTTVIYIYPMSGEDDSLLPEGWDQIPGARGCTPQACSFRDHHKELSRFNALVYGLSTQSTEYQLGEVKRIHLPFALLSDEKLELTTALSLPTIGVKVAGTTVIKRITLICKDRKIYKVFYPVFPPDKNADEVIAWLNGNKA